MLKLPGDAFNLTIHRLILIVILVFWLANAKSDKRTYDVPFFFYLVFISLNTLVSVFLSGFLLFSLKQYLALTLETFLFYIIIVTSFRTSEDAVRLVIYLSWGLTLVGFLAVLERYVGFNPVDALLPGYIRPTRALGTIISTYPHRILLGTAMAIGFPLALSLLLISGFGKKYKHTFLSIISLLLMIAGCYFSTSRGPWLSLIVGGIILYTLGSYQIRKRLVFISFAIAFVLVFSDGVRSTITNRINQTFDIDHQKGQSYQYRWELWPIAYNEVCKSVPRFLWGYGPGTVDTEVIDHTMSYTGKSYEISSWDNHYACQLLQTGFIGLSGLIGLYTAILLRIRRTRKTLLQPYKDVLSGVAAGIVVYMFMMTNVYIYAPQLNYVFWTLIGVCVLLETPKPGLKPVQP